MRPEFDLEFRASGAVGSVWRCRQRRAGPHAPTHQLLVVRAARPPLPDHRNRLRVVRTRRILPQWLSSRGSGVTVKLLPILGGGYPC
jgi:hypothetical protein